RARRAGPLRLAAAAARPAGAAVARAFLGPLRPHPGMDRSPGALLRVAGASADARPDLVARPAAGSRADRDRACAADGGLAVRDVVLGQLLRPGLRRARSRDGDLLLD